jgi:hypothetical protein
MVYYRRSLGRDWHLQTRRCYETPRSVNLANDASSLKRLHKMWLKDFQDTRRVDLDSKKVRIAPDQLEI